MTDFGNFRKFLGDFGSIEWTMAAVKAPMADTTKELAKQIGKEPLKNVSFEQPDKHDTLGPYVVIYQLKECDWTIVIYSLGFWNYLDELTRKLSKKLKTQVLLYEAEDTSAAEGMKLYQNGELEKEILDKHDAEYIDELLEEMSEIEDLADYLPEKDTLTKPPREIVDDYAVVFERYGIKAIGIYAKDNGTAAIESIYQDRIQGVNFILQEDAEEDDEELDDQSEW